MIGCWLEAGESVIGVPRQLSEQSRGRRNQVGIP